MQKAKPSDYVGATIEAALYGSNKLPTTQPAVWSKKQKAYEKAMVNSDIISLKILKLIAEKAALNKKQQAAIIKVHKTYLALMAAQYPEMELTNTFPK